MKKNLILFGVLVLLLAGTYFFQELRSQKAHEAQSVGIIKEDAITSLGFSGIKAQKRNGQWWAENTLLSHNVFRQLEKKLTRIKKIKSVTGKAETYFTHPLPFEVNGEPWQIGDVTLDKQGFYLARGKELMVAIIDGESGEVTDDEAKLAQIKLDDLKDALSVPADQLKETQLFRYYPDLPVGTILVESDGRPSYELDLIQNKTLPAPIAGIEVHSKLAEKFRSLITQVMIKTEVPYDEKLKFTKLGQMTFISGPAKLNWELWIAGDKSADSYIIDQAQKRAFKMIGGTLKPFFTHVQDYWDKKVIPPAKFKSFKRLPVEFIQGDKAATVEIVNQEPLGFETPKYRVDAVQMMTLFRYVFNLSEKDQADRVSPLSASERKQVLSEEHLRMEVLGQELILWRKQQELIVVNLTQGFKAHFIVTDESFRARFEDVLK